MNLKKITAKLFKRNKKAKKGGKKK